MAVAMAMAKAMAKGMAMAKAPEVGSIFSDRFSDFFRKVDRLFRAFKEIHTGGSKELDPNRMAFQRKFFSQKPPGGNSRFDFELPDP